MKNLKRLIEIVDFAYNNCEIYRSLYGSRPSIKSLEDFEELPHISMFNFNMAKLANTLSNTDGTETIIPLQFFSFYENCIPFFLNLGDNIFFKKEIIYLLKLAGINLNEKILILFKQNQCYLGLILANALLQESYSTYIFCLSEYNYSDLSGLIKSYKIRNLLFLCKANIAKINCLDKIGKVIIVNNLNDFHNVDDKARFERYSLYYKPNIGFVAISNLKEEIYRYSSDRFYIETDKQSDLIITCLSKKSLPYIRYCAYDKGIVYDNDSFLISYFFDG